MEIHHHWKGTGICAEAIALMGRAYGSKPGEIVAALGPCIGPCCYAVRDDRYRLFLEEYGSRAVCRDSDGGYRVDLREANAVLLERAGIGGVSAVGDCTCCGPAFGSFRGEGPLLTRMIAMIGSF